MSVALPHHRNYSQLSLISALYRRTIPSYTASMPVNLAPIGSTVTFVCSYQDTSTQLSDCYQRRNTVMVFVVLSLYMIPMIPTCPSMTSMTVIPYDLQVIFLDLFCL
jgi:hypothetical protein